MTAIDGWRKQQAVALPDGGYFGTLTVFHELHCLVRVSQHTSEPFEISMEILMQTLETPSPIHVS